MREARAGDRFLLEWIHRFKGPVYLLLNKIDLIPKPRLLPLIDTYHKAYDFTEIFPISALTGQGLPDLLKSWIEHLPEGPPLFPEDQYTDQPERFLASEVVREKALLRQLIAASNDILREAYSPHDKAENVLENAEKRIFAIAEKKVSGSLTPIGDASFCSMPSTWMPVAP